MSLPVSSARTAIPITPVEHGSSPWPGSRSSRSPVGGPLQPFKGGAGLIAVEGGTPIVPVKLKIHKMSIIDRRRLPASLRGDVELVIGEPMWFDAETDHAAATTRLEAAVAAL